MRINFDQGLYSLAQKLNSPLYAVGGVVRNYLIDPSVVTEDIDLSANIAVEEILPVLNELKFKVVAEYKRTGTVVFKIGKQKYEYTAFRKEVYGDGGGHTPITTQPTDDIREDALRRDFKCNAVYYDILNEQIVDPLGGVKDIENKVLDTVKQPEKVFESDGLRLMRLARFAGELAFRPTDDVIGAMKKYASNIKDISCERIYDELKKILVADSKYAFSDKRGHYVGLKILEITKVLDEIMPELTLGRGMSQRADFHKYDVLEHSLRCALYSPKEIRLAGLLHDVGKPYCYLKNGKYYYHEVEGERIAIEILKRLKVDNATVKQVRYLIREHMVDLDCSMRENKVRLFLAKNYNKLDDLFKVKQADFRASLESDEVSPTITKWQKIITKMQKEGVPLTLKELNIRAEELGEIGFMGQEIGEMLTKIFELAVIGGVKNQKEELVKFATFEKRELELDKRKYKRF